MAETTPLAPAPKARASRWLKIGLIASLALNVAFIGWGATRFVKYHRMGERPGAQIEERIARRLPDNAAQAFRQAMDTNRGGEPISFHALRRDIAEALAAEPFDRARFEALMSEHRGRLDRFQQGLQAGLLAAADTMTPEQRKDYAEKMLRHGRRHKDR